MKTIDELFAIYLKEHKGLNRLMEYFKLKYISLGRYSGTVIIKNVSSDESYDLSNLFGKNIKIGDDFKTSFSQLEKKMSFSKYAGFEWDKLFYYYFDEKILSNKIQRYEDNLAKNNFFDSIINENSDKKNIKQIQEILNNPDLYKLLNNKYKRNKNLLRNDLNNIILLLDNIPTMPTALSVYSSLTGNPHYLDLNGHEVNLFLKFLSLMQEVEYPKSTIDRINLLEQINVYIDPISNFVITYKLTGNSILNALNDKNEIVNLNLSNILNLMDNIDTDKKNVYIFENPSILNTLKYLKVPMIITSGMPNISLYKTLDVLQKNGNKLYYNGDFDPEGLLIAQKLKDKYSNLELFGYSEGNYLSSKSHKKVNLSRLSKLKHVNDNELLIIKNMLLKYKQAAYQENNIEQITMFILNNEHK